MRVQSKNIPSKFLIIGLIGGFLLLAFWVRSFLVWDGDPDSCLQSFSVDSLRHPPFVAGIDDTELILSREGTSIELNPDYFSELTRKSAIGISPGSQFAIGQFKDLEFNQYTPSDVVEFLIKSQYIGTRDHLHADVCLKSENDSNEEYVAHYSAIHHYCTNECIEEGYKFSVKIDKMNGDIILYE